MNHMRIVLIALSLVLFTSYSAMGQCYQTFLLDGKKFMRLGKWDRAIESFENGKLCQADKPANGDVTLDGLINDVRLKKKAAREDDKAWEEIQNALDVDVCQHYLDKFGPNARHLNEAQQCIENLSDLDGDGIPYINDRCPDVPGPASNSGCKEENLSYSLQIAAFRIGEYFDSNKFLIINDLGDCYTKDENGFVKIRLGMWPDRNTATSILPKVINAGFKDAFVVTENPNDEKLRKLVIQRNEKDLFNMSNLVLVTGGTFDMGNNSGDGDEKPIHSVTLNDFYLSKYEITVAEFKKFVDNTGYKTDAEKEGWSYAWTDSTWENKKNRNWRHDVQGMDRKLSAYNHPVIHVSWNDASEYCKWLSQKTGKMFRLPTESEWEYAAGGGDPQKNIRTLWAGTSAETDLRYYANYGGTGGIDAFQYTAPVGSFRPNRLGIYDMSGNVWEWCLDWKSSYTSSAQTNPIGPDEGTYRVLRGGSWRWGTSGQYHCRATYRYNYDPLSRSDFIGFRIAMSYSRL